jgi:hypothetical protein
MNRLFHVAVIVMLAFETGGCNRHATTGAASTPESGKLNSAAPSSVMSPNAGSTQVDPEEPKAGMNTARPDSVKDVTQERK